MLWMQRRPAGFELDGARGVQRPREVQDPLDRVPHADRLGRQRQLAGLDPRDVEDLVDEGQEVSPSLGDLLDALAIRRPFDLELQELGESENRVERGPELVAHPGEELALGPIRAIGVRLRPLPLRDLTLELRVGRAQLARSFLHPLLELLRLTLHALVEPCLSQSDRELGGHFLRDADLLGGNLAWRSAAAPPPRSIPAPPPR